MCVGEGVVLSSEGGKRRISLCKGLLAKSAELQADLMQKVVFFRVRWDGRWRHCKSGVLLGERET